MKSRMMTVLAVAALAAVGAGCAKKVTAIPPAAPAAAPARADSQTLAETNVSTPAAPRRTVAQTPAREPMPDAATRVQIQELLNRIQDAYFDYDKHLLRPDAEAALRQDAQTLAEIVRQYPAFKLTIEGHADERGSQEYNLALGDARAKQAKEYLATLGLPSDQLREVSYGKERPVCSESNENCWQRNRRAHLTQAQGQ